MMALTVELPWFIAGKLSPCHMIILQMKYHFVAAGNKNIYFYTIFRIHEDIDIYGIEPNHFCNHIIVFF